MSVKVTIEKLTEKTAAALSEYVKGDGAETKCAVSDGVLVLSVDAPGDAALLIESARAYASSRKDRAAASALTGVRGKVERKVEAGDFETVEDVKPAKRKAAPKRGGSTLPAKATTTAVEPVAEGSVWARRSEFPEPVVAELDLMFSGKRGTEVQAVVQSVSEVVSPEQSVGVFTGRVRIALSQHAKTAAAGDRLAPQP